MEKLWTSHENTLFFSYLYFHTIFWRFRWVCEDELTYLHALLEGRVFMHYVIPIVVYMNQHSALWIIIKSDGVYKYKGVMERG